MPYCDKCGKKNPDDAEYCNKCGKYIRMDIPWDKKIEIYAEKIGDKAEKFGKHIEKKAKAFGKSVEDTFNPQEKYCKDCGCRLRSNALYCWKCGKKFE